MATRRVKLSKLYAGMRLDASLRTSYLQTRLRARDVIYICVVAGQRRVPVRADGSSVQSTTYLSDKTLGFLSDSAYLEKLQNVKPGKEALFTVQERLVEKKASSKTF